MKSTHRILTLAASSAMLLAAPLAGAYSVQVVGGTPVRWASPIVEYYLQQAGSDDLTGEQSLNAIYKAYESWNELGCSDLEFVEVGGAPDPGTTLLAGASANLKSEVVWIEDDTWYYGGYVLGVTAPLYGGDAVIFEADVAFNGYSLTWKVSGGGGGNKTDLESVAVHEFGHQFGLQHNLGPYDSQWWDGPTMNPSILPQSNSRSLEDDDIRGACFLYPAAEDYICDGDDDCPMIVSNDSEGEEYYAGEFGCDASFKTCTQIDLYPVGVSNLGESCTVDANCMEDLYCQPWNEGAVCTGYCETSNSQCPDGFDCAPFQNYPQYGACLPSDGEIKEPEISPQGCTGAADCFEGGLCLPTPTGATKMCTTLCDVASGMGCSPDQGCFDYGQGSDQGGCFPLDMFPPEPGDLPGDDGGDVGGDPPIEDPTDDTPIDEPGGGTDNSDPNDPGADGGTDDTGLDTGSTDETPSGATDVADPGSTDEGTTGDNTEVDPTLDAPSDGGTGSIGQSGNDGCAGGSGSSALWILALLLIAVLPRRRAAGNVCA